MNLYKITYISGLKDYVVAENLAEIEKNITLIKRTELIREDIKIIKTKNNAEK